jgi:hypothetical protein
MVFSTIQERARTLTRPAGAVATLDDFSPRTDSPEGFDMARLVPFHPLHQGDPPTDSFDKFIVILDKIIVVMVLAIIWRLILG